MANSLPIKLNKEPLIDAVFEVRFSSKIPATMILPGALFNSLQGEKSIEQLPIANLPKPVRDADPNLKFAPLNRIDWNQFFINIGDSSLSISCKYPYCGWADFKIAIIEVINVLNQCKLADTVGRYAMKYVDIFPTSEYPQKFSMINASISVAGHTLNSESFQLRIEIARDELIHAVQLASSAIATLHNGTTIEGLILDVDTSSIQNNITMDALLENFSDKLDSIHLANKSMFFDCLTRDAITSLEPIYE
jgi:uncharacterized protein (TIGR04255 family)